MILITQEVPFFMAINITIFVDWNVNLLEEIYLVNLFNEIKRQFNAYKILFRIHEEDVEGEHIFLALNVLHKIVSP